MNINIIKKVKEFLGNIEYKKNTSSESELNIAESELNIKLNEEFKFFIKNFGGCYIGIDIYGIKNADDLEQISFIDLTKSYRKQGYPNLDDKYVISFDGSDNPISMNFKGEIFIYNHDNGDFSKIANSFSQLILDNIY